MKNKNVKIRKAKLDDLPTLLEFEQGIIEAERPMDSTLISHRKISYYDIESMITEENVEVLVAEINGTLVGSGYARVIDSDSFRTHPRHVYLGFMFVPKSHRGQGIISKILDGLKAWAISQDITELKLEVYHNNPSAIKAYEKAGFKINLMEMRMGI